METFSYIYEFHRGDEVLATGVVALDHEVEIGERVRIGSREGLVRQVLPTLQPHERRIVIQQLPAEGDDR